MTRRRTALQLRNQRAVVFAVLSRLGYTVRTTRGYWTLITTVKHPSVAGKERVVFDALTQPEQIRVSKVDQSVFLFYRRLGARFLCVVTRRVSSKSGFIVTAYLIDKIKEGRLAWKK